MYLGRLVRRRKDPERVDWTCCGRVQRVVSEAILNAGDSQKLFPEVISAKNILLAT